MKRINILVIISIWLLCTANNCNRENCHKVINFINNSSKEVYIHGGNYPDTLFYGLFPNPNLNPNIFRVKSGESNNNAAGVRHRCHDASVAQGRVFVYVFDAQVLATVPWDTIGKHYMVLKTYHPTLEEMESSNWTITYTGE
jgi:hypothetical protein